MTCEPLFGLLKKGKKFQWDGRCQAAFEQIKEYLQNPLVLAPPEPRKPLILYLSVTETTMGCMLTQESEDKVVRAIYYQSKKMLEYETRYTPLEKACLALVWASRKLRHYLLAHSVMVISRLNPIKSLFEKPALTGRLARWLLLLSEFVLIFVMRKSIKG